jgi:hypothetical protein
MPVFTYRQFYIGVSYTLSIEGLSILLLSENLSRTLNITYSKVLAIYFKYFIFYRYFTDPIEPYRSNKGALRSGTIYNS